jgi:hypothetical protein
MAILTSSRTFRSPCGMAIDAIPSFVAEQNFQNLILTLPHRPRVDAFSHYLLRNRSGRKR